MKSYAAIAYTIQSKRRQHMAELDDIKDGKDWAKTARWTVRPLLPEVEKRNI